MIKEIDKLNVLDSDDSVHDGYDFDISSLYRPVPLYTGLARIDETLILNCYKSDGILVN